MTKKTVAFLLAAACLVCMLASCHDGKIDGDTIKGAEIQVYMSEMIYDFDPATVYNNDSALQILSLMYDTLFTLNKNGKVEKSLAKSYEFTTDTVTEEYKMIITLREGTSWSDGTYVSAQDVVYAWKRILDPEFNCEAACLLYDVKNAQEAKLGNTSIDSVGVYASDELRVEITFVSPDVDTERFLLNLTSVALAPLRENVISRNGDWAKKSSTIVCSGPFMLRRSNYGFDTSGKADNAYREIVLERNPYYRRTAESKYLDKSVTPYRILFNYYEDSSQVMTEFNSGNIFYVGNVPLASRSEYKDKATVEDLMSTHAYYFNENADVAVKGGKTEKLFADKNVRLALSAAIDRAAIAEQIVFAKPATGFVPYKVYDTTKKTSFREVGGSLISTGADLAAAQNYIAASGKTPSDYTFAISVRSDDEVDLAIANIVCESWKSLGFNVSVNVVKPTINDDEAQGAVATDIYDDNFLEYFMNGTKTVTDKDGNTTTVAAYEVIAVDIAAYSPDAFSVLAPFATRFSGQGQDMSSSSDYITPEHKTGYISEEYNAKIEAAYAEKDAAKRAALLHEAETVLVADMPVMPVVFNQTAYLASKDLSGIKTNYYGVNVFTKVKQKHYTDYIVTVADSGAEEKPSDEDAAAE